MSKVIVKICGLTRVEDVRAVIKAGADAVGFVFTASPRRINVERAIELVKHVPDGVLRVGLFLDQHQSEIEEVTAQVPLDILQFHGSESESECNGFGLPWLKAVAMENTESVQQAEREYSGACGLLLDSHSKGKRGGSGRMFDWSMVRPVTKPIWLAGGLDAQNVGEAIGTIRPFAVDVSSGVESEPGIKDADRVMAFVQAVRQAEIHNMNGKSE